MLSEEILKDRAGNFTASENHRLMAGWDKKKPKEPLLICLEKEFMAMESKPLVGFVKSEFQVDVTGADVNELWQWVRWHDTPQGLITYAQEKALETLFDYDESLNWSTAHTRNGEEREAECMKKLIKKTEIDFICTGEDQAHLHENSIGATPDGIVFDNSFKVYSGAEVKCKSPLEHAKLWLVNNNDDLKSNYFEGFVQIQTQMLVTKTDHWHFAIFNPFAVDWMKFKNIIISRDDEFIEILKQRIETARRIKAEFLEQFKQLEQIK